MNINVTPAIKNVMQKPAVRKGLFTTLAIALPLAGASLVKRPGESLNPVAPAPEPMTEFEYAMQRVSLSMFSDPPKTKHFFNLMAPPYQPKEFQYDKSASILENAGEYAETAAENLLDRCEDIENRLNARAQLAFNEGDRRLAELEKRYTESNDPIAREKQNKRHETSQKVFDNVIDPIAERPALPLTATALALLGLSAGAVKKDE